jgi:hypothetical protein
LNQDYDDKELIIFNTATVPLSLDNSIANVGIRVINQPKCIVSGEFYSSLGSVRKSAMTHAGDVYICWDDDVVDNETRRSTARKSLENSRKFLQSFFSGPLAWIFFRDR